MTKQYTPTERCQALANEVVQYAYAEKYECYCGAKGYLDTFEKDAQADEFCCPKCGRVSDIDDLRPLDLFYYFDEVTQFHFTVDQDLQFVSVRVLVSPGTYGADPIYVDTGKGRVELYAQGKWYYASLPDHTIEEVNYHFEQIFSNQMGLD